MPRTKREWPPFKPRPWGNCVFQPCGLGYGIRHLRRQKIHMRCGASLHRFPEFTGLSNTSGWGAVFRSCLVRAKAPRGRGALQGGSAPGGVFVPWVLGMAAGFRMAALQVALVAATLNPALRTGMWDQAPSVQQVNRERISRSVQFFGSRKSGICSVPGLGSPGSVTGPPHRASNAQPQRSIS